MPIFSKKQAQVEALIFDEILTAFPVEYSNYSNVFLAKNTANLLKYNEINDYAIKLKKDK